mmetsp:Transcript_9076/g.13335  ORF Transcript_9076/g.13335 Transcript_9076/m.13335 type:complete len:182 (+) Transcript_9076:3-548(+)
MSADMEASGLNHTVVGTSRYMSPERVLDKAYGPPSDIWAFGLVLIECATGGWSPLYYGDDRSMNESTKNVDGGSLARRRRFGSIVELAIVLDDFNLINALQVLEKRQRMADPQIRTVVDWSKEVHGTQGIGEVLMWTLQRLPGKRIPAQILLESPWFDKCGLGSINSAQKAVREYLATIAI